jgi:hypothetical protein
MHYKTSHSDMSKRASVGFVNDYNLSSVSNLAPAAGSDDDGPGIGSKASLSTHRQEEGAQQAESKGQMEKATTLARFGSRLIQRAKGIGQSPSRTRHTTQEKPQIVKTRSISPMRNPTQIDRSQLRSMDELEVGFPSSRQAQKPEKMSSKEKRRVFQRLSDEKVPDDKKFKNRRRSANYINNKFGSMNFEDSADTPSSLKASAGSISEQRSSSDFPPLRNDDLDDNFVDGLIFFAPTSEETIRKLVNKDQSAI